jgi:two-component system NtrC family sensor kinase
MTTEGKLLVIDDEEGVRDLLKTEFERRGYAVVVVSNGYEALRLLEDQSFDVVLCDIRMPGMDGLETLATLQKQFPDLQVIIMTGYASIETVLAVMKNGAFDVVEKPFHLDHVVSLVNRALTHRNMRMMVSVYEMSRTVFETMDLDYILKTIAENLGRLIAADEVSILMRRDGQMWERAFAPAIAKKDWVSDHQTLATLAQRRLSEERTPFLAPEAILLDIPGVVSALFCPMHMEENWQVLLLAVRRAPHDIFHSLDLRCATIFSSFGAQAVRNARLYDQLIQRWKELDGAHRSLQEAKSQSVQNEKMAAMGQLAAGVAHELNNPMTGIMGFSQLLADDPSLSETQRKDAETIFQQSQRCQKIIRNLLQYSRRSDAVKKKVDLKKVIETADELSRYDVVVKKIQMKFDFKSDSLPVYGDVTELQTLFLNLLKNARQAVQGNADPSVEIEAAAHNGWVRVHVQDNGTGITASDLPQIFDPFFTTKSAGQGTGLGLSLCQTIVKNCGGRLSAESRVGQGSVFTVEFPQAF